MGIYDGVIFLPSGKFDHIDDGVRAKADTQDVVSKLMIHDYSHVWENRNNNLSPGDNRFYFNFINSIGAEDRTKEIIEGLNEM
jgi:hypothetical protein